MKSRPHQESCCSSQWSREALNICTSASRMGSGTEMPLALSSSVPAASRLSTSDRNTWQRAARRRGSFAPARTCSSCSLHSSALLPGASSASRAASVSRSSASISCLMYCCTSMLFLVPGVILGCSLKCLRVQKPRAASGTLRPSLLGDWFSRMKSCTSFAASQLSPAFTVASRSYCRFRSHDVSKTASFIKPSVRHLPRFSSMSCTAERMYGICAS
mmetsp:Transcript_90622/g.233920  ORF Transcript_90622/g.233920 Transcript_90622/m.233920 type:complete len:217 (+) Transcript_90622:724-1374(+)